MDSLTKWSEAIKGQQELYSTENFARNINLGVYVWIYRN